MSDKLQFVVPTEITLDLGLLSSLVKRDDLDWDFEANDGTHVIKVL